MTVMNIYLIEQSVNNGYDTYDSAVVTAVDEEAARIMNPSGFRTWSKELKTWMFVCGDGRQTPEGEDDVWAHPKDVKVTKIGTSDNKEAKVICASFNAG